MSSLTKLGMLFFLVCFLNGAPVVRAAEAANQGRQDGAAPLKSKEEIAKEKKEKMERLERQMNSVRSAEKVSKLNNLQSIQNISKAVVAVPRAGGTRTLPSTTPTQIPKKS